MFKLIWFAQMMVPTGVGLKQKNKTKAKKKGAIRSLLFKTKTLD